MCESILRYHPNSINDSLDNYHSHHFLPIDVQRRENNRKQSGIKTWMFDID